MCLRNSADPKYVYKQNIPLAKTKEDVYNINTETPYFIV